jgi:hypothetical protein
MFSSKNRQGVKTFEAPNELELEGTIGAWLLEDGKDATVFSVSMAIDPTPTTANRYKAMVAYTIVRYQS